MNILFHFVSLPNLENDTGIFTSLIHEFKRNGHNVKVVTKDRTGEKTRVVKENGIDVLRINCHNFTGVSSNIKKALAYMEYTFKLVHCTKKYFKNEHFDMIYSHSLPPEIGFAERRLKQFFKCAFYLLVTDFIWKDAVAFGYYSKNGPIGLYYRYWEKQMFKYADCIGVPTKGNVTFIRKMYPWITEDRFSVYPFWQKPIDIKPDNSTKERFGLAGKFVVIYGGSVGAAQRVERLIELAESCKDYKKIAFVILGKGAYLPVIKQMAKDKNLENVIFKEFIPQDDYLQFLASCDVGMIILHEKMATPNFPSKSLSYLNMKVPILAALDHVTDFGEYMVENNAGLWAYSDDIPSLKEQLLRYYGSKDLCENIKENGFKLYIEKCTPIFSYNTIMKQLNNE